MLIGVKVKKKNSGEIFVRMFQSCNNSKKGKDAKREWAKESINKFRTISNLEDKADIKENSEGF